MEFQITRMLENYETGQISRRQLVQGLALMAAGGHLTGSSSSVFQGVEVNHVALDVTDVQRSRNFYQKLLGLPVVRESRSNCFLGLKQNFLALFQAESAAMNHYCIGIRDYDIDKVTAELQRRELQPHRPAGTKRVYFKDPDGLTVQLSAQDHQP